MIHEVKPLPPGFPQRANLEAERRSGTRSYTNAIPPATGGTVATSGGAFCELFQDVEEDWFIRGGDVSIGIKNFNVPDFEVVTSTDDVFLVYIEADVTVRRDDDNDYFLTGFEGTTETALVMERTSADNYPDNTAPLLSSGVGKIVFRVGVLTIADGAPSFSPTGCGGFDAVHCGGSITYKRL